MAESIELFTQLPAKIESPLSEQAKAVRRAGIISGCIAGIVERAIGCIGRGHVGEAKRLLEADPEAQAADRRVNER